MGKVFVNDNLQTPSAVEPVGDAAQTVAQVLAVLFGLAVVAGLCVLLYHCWKLTVPFVLAAALFACGLSRAVPIGLMGLAVLVFAVIGNAARGQTIVDGDTIKLDGTRWRLWGIDAPEMDQTCGNWTASVAATHALAGLMRDKTIICELRGRDRYGRSIGLCRANGEDLGAGMVSAGMAWAFTRYSSDYISQERAALACGSAFMRITA